MPNAKNNNAPKPKPASDPQPAKKSGGNKALNVVGYGFGVVRIIAGLITGVVLISLGIYMSSGKVKTGDPIAVTATLKEPGVYEVPVPDSDGVRRFETGDERKDETIVVYYDRIEGGITLTEPTIDKRAGWILIGLGILGVLFTLVFWWLLRTSPTFRRIYGGVSAVGGLT